MELLRERGVEFDTIEYLKTPPTRETLEKILTMLEGPPADLVRKDKRFRELGLKAEDYVEPKKIVTLLLAASGADAAPDRDSRQSRDHRAPAGEAGGAAVAAVHCLDRDRLRQSRPKVSS